jgi:hypothetical protein
MPGFSTFPTLAAIYLFKLNPVATMLVNYLVTPLDFAGVLPFM